jgi:hypothetical protein
MAVNFDSNSSRSTSEILGDIAGDPIFPSDVQVQAQKLAAGPDVEAPANRTWALSNIEAAIRDLVEDKRATPNAPSIIVRRLANNLEETLKSLGATNTPLFQGLQTALARNDTPVLVRSLRESAGFAP